METPQTLTKTQKFEAVHNAVQKTLHVIVNAKRPEIIAAEILALEEKLAKAEKKLAELSNKKLTEEDLRVMLRTELAASKKLKASEDRHKRIRIAELCGWKFIEQGGMWRLVNPEGETVDEGHPSKEYLALLTPDYFNDLNAMRKAELTLREPYLSEYYQELRWELTAAGVGGIFPPSKQELLLASARQKAEAFIRVFAK